MDDTDSPDDRSARVSPQRDSRESESTSGRVLVLDSHRRQGVVAVRSLGRHGKEVTAASHRRWNSGGASKYAARTLEYPSPSDENAFVDAIARELGEREYDLVLPSSSATAPAVVRNRERLQRHTAVPFLPWEDFRVGLDKSLTADAARSADVPIPETMELSEPDAEAVEARLDYPVVVKPKREAGRLGVHICETRNELTAALESVGETHGRPLVQEYVPNGGEFGVYTLYDWSSNLVGLTVQRRLRTNPPGGGPSSLRETVSRPELVELADRLFTDLGWRGVAMAEFRIDPRDGEPKLLEINPRLWGSLALSVFAGVDFPNLLYQCATTGSCERVLDYRVGVQARNLTGEIGHLLGREDRLQALRELFSPAGAPCTFDVLSLRDPLPGVVHLTRAGTALLGGET